MRHRENTKRVENLFLRDQRMTVHPTRLLTKCGKLDGSLRDFPKSYRDIRREDPLLGKLAPPIDLHDDDVRVAPLYVRIRSAISNK